MNGRDVRYPTLSEAGARMLAFMAEHPAAPAYRNSSGNKLLAEEVAALLAFEREVASAQVGWAPGTRPAWLNDFVQHTWEGVPHYRASGSMPSQFDDIEPVSRADLSADITQFVPDHVDTARMINFRTTGTTGHPMIIPSHPVVAGSYLGFHKRALAHVGISLRHGQGQVGVVLLGHQRKCFTYVSVTPAMNESGLAKINLHTDDWRHADDRARYLDALAPEVIAGDPISFAELLTLDLKTRPRAILSVSMLLLPGMRARLERRFDCPVLDIYSLNEVGPVGMFDAALGGHLLLQPSLYVEILDRHGRPVADGERGEITVSGGFNFCLPLLRYRTGDYGSIAYTGQGPVIVGLSGRSPVRFRTGAGHWINNIDVTHALHPLAIPHFGFHQHTDGALTLRLSPSAMLLADDARRALSAVFGSQPVDVKPLLAEDKTIQYSSDLAGAHP